MERMAERYIEDCQYYKEIFMYANHILEQSTSTLEVIQRLMSMGMDNEIDLEVIYKDPYSLNRGVSQRIRSINLVPSILEAARSVHRFHFKDSTSSLLLQQEATFAYACKMISGSGPDIRLFSETLTNEEIAEMELFLALHTPLVVFMEPSQIARLYCSECLEDILEPMASAIA